MPIELPKLPKAKAFHAMLAPLWNFLRRSKVNAGEGIELSEHGESGILITAKRQQDNYWRSPFEPYCLVTSGTKLKVERSWLYEIYPVDPEDVLAEHDIWMDTVDDGRQKMQFEDDDGISPFWSVAASVSYNYLHFKTDDKGRVIDLDDDSEEFAELVTSATERDTVHFELPDGEGNDGVEGEYYLLIFKTKADPLGELAIDYDAKPTLRQHHRTVRGYNAIENIGGGKGEIYKEYDLDSDFKRFRTLAEDYAIGLGVLDGITIKWLAENIGAGEPVYNEDDTTDKAEFRTLVERASNPQIQISSIGGPPADEIRIEGNNNDVDIVFVNCATPTPVELLRMQFRDGLLTSPVDDVTIPIESCPGYPS